jgi:hypothetical protein
MYEQEKRTLIMEDIMEISSMIFDEAGVSNEIYALFFRFPPPATSLTHHRSTIKGSSPRLAQQPSHPAAERQRIRARTEPA